MTRQWLLFRSKRDISCDINETPNPMVVLKLVSLFDTNWLTLSGETPPIEPVKISGGWWVPKVIQYWAPGWLMVIGGYEPTITNPSDHRTIGLGTPMNHPRFQLWQRPLILSLESVSRSWINLRAWAGAVLCSPAFKSLRRIQRACQWLFCAKKMH